MAEAAALCQNCNDDADGNYQCGAGDPNACGACRKLAELQEKIKETRILLNGFKRECWQLKKQANHHHDPYIHRLPPEVASLIFEFCVPDIMSLDLANLSTSTYSIYAPLVLSAVCHKWRAIAHTTPQLWKVIPLICRPDLELDNNDSEDGISEHTHILVKEWLDRAGELPISLNLYSSIHEYDLEDPYYDVTESTDNIINILRDYSARWLHLKYTGIPRLLYRYSSDIRLVLPQLHTLDLTMTANLDPIQEGRYQPLDLYPTQLEILSINKRMFSALPGLNWSHLTQLTVSYDTRLSECFEILRIAPFLARLAILLSPNGIDEIIEFPLPQHPILHPKLQYLQFSAGFDSVHESFLTYLTCPSLKTLGVNETHQRVVMSHVIKFLKRSGCSLEKLSINCKFLFPADITSLCKGVPTLLHLWLAFHGRFIPTILFSHLAAVSTGANEPKYLPFLRSMNLSSPTFFAWAKLPDIFGTRTPHSIDRRRHALYSVKISMSVPPKQPSERLSKPDLAFDIDEETLNRILWLKNSSDVKWKIIGGEDEEDMIAMAIDWYREQ